MHQIAFSCAFNFSNTNSLLILKLLSSTNNTDVSVESKTYKSPASSDAIEIILA